MASSEQDGTASESLTRPTAIAVAVLVTIRTTIASIPIGVMAGLAAAPMWIPSLRRYRGGVILASMLVISVAWGIALTKLQEPLNGGTSTRILLSHSLLLVFILSGSGVLLWAREHLSERAVGLAAGSGLVITSALSGAVSPSGIQWKAGLAIPLSVVVLALVAGARRWQFGIVALLILSATNVLLDSRSAFAICALAALLYLAQRSWSKPSNGSIRARALSLLLAAVVTAAALYKATAHLLMTGYLGEEAQQRSMMQEELSGSMLVGGRPEMAATWALMTHRPAGFGAGAIASTEDVMVAKAGMWAINYQPDNGYVENFMFGAGIRLHSIIGDMWAHYGLAGVVLALVIAVLLAHALFVRLATGTASALTIFLIITTLWNLPFGPLWSSTPAIALTLGLALLRRDTLAPARTIIAERLAHRAQQDQSAAGSKQLRCRLEGVADPVVGSVPLRPSLLSTPNPPEGSTESSNRHSGAAHR